MWTCRPVSEGTKSELTPKLAWMPILITSRPYQHGSRPVMGFAVRIVVAIVALAVRPEIFVVSEIVKLLIQSGGSISAKLGIKT